MGRNYNSDKHREDNFDYENARLDLFDSGADPDYLDYRNREKRDSFMREQGFDPQKYGSRYEPDSRSDSSSSGSSFFDRIFSDDSSDGSSSGNLYENGYVSDDLSESEFDSNGLLSNTGSVSSSRVKVSHSPEYEAQLDYNRRHRYGQYKRIYTHDENIRLGNSPVFLRTGILLRNVDTQDIYAEFKFQSLSPKTVKGCLIQIVPLDKDGKHSGKETEHLYEGIQVHVGECFGNSVFIKMPDRQTAGFDLTILKVYFEDKSLWANVLYNKWEKVSEETLRRLNDEGPIR